MKELSKDKEALLDRAVRKRPPKTEEEGKKAIEELAQKYREVFTTPIGKEVLNDLIVKCGFFSVSTVSQDQLSTGFRDGRRSIALMIIEQLQTARYLSDNDISDLVKI